MEGSLTNGNRTNESNVPLNIAAIKSTAGINMDIGIFTFSLWHIFLFRSLWNVIARYLIV